MYVNKELLNNITKGVLCLPKGEDFRNIINNLKVEKEDNDLRVKISLCILSKDKIIVNRCEELINPIFVKEISPVEGADTLTHLIYTLRDIVIKQFGSPCCEKFMEKTTLVPYGFYVDGYLYVCYCLYADNETLDKFSEQNDNLSLISLQGDEGRNFSNMSKRGRIVIQPFLK